MFGISYGAGISLLAAAHDRRVRAVAALSTWTDMAASLYPNGTTSTASLGGLFYSAERTGGSGRRSRPWRISWVAIRSRPAPRRCPEPAALAVVDDRRGSTEQAGDHDRERLGGFDLRAAAVISFFGSAHRSETAAARTR